MSSIRLPQSPGIGGLNELTTLEETLVQNLASLSYAAGDVLYHNGTSFVRLPIGTDGQVLTVNDTATAVGWEAGGGVSDPELLAIAGLTSAANKIPMFSGSGTATLLDFKDEDNMSSNSATALPSQQSVKAYVDGILAANDAMVFEGVIDASTNPNYPAADSGSTYKISVAGKVGGASGTNVEVNDMVICTVDGSSAGTQAAVGSNWVIIQANIDNAVTTTATQTLTNKRIDTRVVTAASYTTNTGTSLDVATCDEFVITAQAGALLFNNPSGTPTEGQKLIIRIKDNGTARALTFDTQFRASTDVPLPTTTVLSKTLYMGFIYNSTDTKWDLVATLNNL